MFRNGRRSTRPARSMRITPHFSTTNRRLSPGGEVRNTGLESPCMIRFSRTAADTCELEPAHPRAEATAVATATIAIRRPTRPMVALIAFPHGHRRRHPGRIARRRPVLGAGAARLRAPLQGLAPGGRPADAVQ